MEKIQKTLAKINQLALDIVVPYQTLSFQAEVLSGELLIITASTDTSYWTNFVIHLDGVCFISGHLNWSWDDEHNQPAVELIEPNDSLPILREDSFFIRFNNTNLGIFPLIIMVKRIDLTIEKFP